jgi:ketosteroid isomerase-like protein
MILRTLRTAGALAALASLAAPPARADLAGEVKAAYAAFVADQNSRDPDRIRRHLIAGADLLWVSDGKSFWGADAILARMSGFQKAAVWRVEPELGAARVVPVGADAALLHMPLTLVIGDAGNPDRLRFLVSLIWVQRDGAWRLAGLLTTEAKP